MNPVDWFPDERSGFWFCCYARPAAPPKNATCRIIRIPNLLESQLGLQYSAKLMIISHYLRFRWFSLRHILFGFGNLTIWPTTLGSGYGPWPRAILPLLQVTKWNLNTGVNVEYTYCDSEKHIHPNPTKWHLCKQIQKHWSCQRMKL